MGKRKDAIVAGIYRLAMRVDRTKSFPGTKTIGIIIRTVRLEHDTIRNLITLAEANQGRFSVTTDRSGRQTFSPMIVFEDDTKPQFGQPAKEEPKPIDVKDTPCPECARIVKDFGPLTVYTKVGSPIPDLLKFQKDPEGHSALYLHPYCADLLGLLKSG